MVSGGLVSLNHLRKWDKETLAYVAGFLDGEGTFHCGKGCKIGILASNCYLPVVEYLQKTFGGRITKGRKKKSHHRYCYQWGVTGKDAANLCMSIIPYLKEKAPQAAMLLTIRQTSQGTGVGKRVPQEIQEERTRLKLILKGMKHVEWTKR